MGGSLNLVVVVFGVKDRVKGRDKAIVGVPHDVNPYLLQKAVYERTDPHITPTFDWIEVPEGLGRLLMMIVYPGMPPYTESNGSATVRVGKDCQPLTGSMRAQMCIGIIECLAELMDRLRLVNRSNLGVPRIYKSLLIEGKSLLNMRK